MNISDWINVALCILSLVLAVISVITVIITLRQNHQMIENATRPYVTIYGAVTGFDATMFYLVLRNYGQSCALITEFSSHADLSHLVLDEHFPVPFEHIVGHTLAPNQAIQFPINHFGLKPEDVPLTFTIRYSCSEKTYTEVTTVNIQSHGDKLIVHANPNDSHIHVISNTLQEMAVRQL